MIINEHPCECHTLTLPRWDIYICDNCGRQLAFLSEDLRHPTLMEKARKFIKGSVKNDNQ